MLSPIKTALTIVALCVAIIPGGHAEKVTVFLDNGSNAPGSSNVGTPFAVGARESSWDVTATAEKGLAGIGAAVMSVRMVPFNQNANSRAIGEGYGRGLGITTATNPSWMDSGQAVSFEFSFYSDAAKSMEIKGLKITLDSLLVQSMSDDLAMDVYAGTGSIILSAAENEGYVSIGGIKVIDGHAGDLALSFIEEVDRVAENTGVADAYYTIPSNGSIVFTENDVIWMRRRNLNGVENTVYRLGGFTLDVVSVPGYIGWAGGWDGVDIGSETNDYDGDGVTNIREYGLGGDPTNPADQGMAPEFEIADAQGENVLNYTHPQLADPDSDLDYSIECNTNLFGGMWTHEGCAIIETNVTGAELNLVSAVTDMTDRQKFVRLHISRDKTLFVDDFGAVGDGVQNDIGPVVDALVALRKLGSDGSLEFSAGKTYKLGLRSDSLFQIDLQGLTNVTVNGNGAMLLNTPEQATIRVEHCEGVTVKNFVIEQSPLSYSQGVITSIHPDGDYFEMETLPGFPLSIEAQNTALSNYWDWGSIIDPVLKRIRPDMTSYFFVSDITNPTGQIFRVYMDGQAFKNQLKNYGRIGDIWFQPLQFNSTARLNQIGAARYTPNIHVTRSADILMENITLYSGRSSMCNSVTYNRGLITYRGFKLMIPENEPERLVSNWRGGFNCQNNRIGPVIEDCYFASQLDDSININFVAARAWEIIPGTDNQTFRMGPETYTAENAKFFVGDDVMVFHPTTGEYIGPIKVSSVDTNNPALVTFASPVPDVITNEVVNGEQSGTATHFYNLDMCGSGFVIRNNTFMPQRRHAVLIRATDGLIAGNTIEGVGGNGIILTQELFEGPFPQNIVISNNVISNPYRVPLSLGSDAGSHLVGDVDIVCNTITASNTVAVELNNVRDVRIGEHNQFYEADRREMTNPFSITNSINIDIL